MATAAAKATTIGVTLQDTGMRQNITIVIDCFEKVATEAQDPASWLVGEHLGTGHPQGAQHLQSTPILVFCNKRKIELVCIAKTSSELADVKVTCKWQTDLCAKRT